MEAIDKWYEQLSRRAGYIALSRDEIEDYRGWVADHIQVDIVDNTDGQIEDAPRVSKLMAIYVDDYRPAEGEEWDVDKWEERSGRIYAPAARKFWRVAYGVARILAAGKCTGAYIEEANGSHLIELPCHLVLS